MKLKAFCKLTLKQIRREFFQYVFVFAIFPLALGGLIGYFQHDIFTPSVDKAKIELGLVDEDNTQCSKALTGFLKSDGIESFIALKENDSKAKLELVIPKGYENSLLSSREGSVRLKVKEEGLKESTAIITGLLDRYNQEISQKLLIEKNLEEKSLSPQQRQELLDKIGKELGAAYSSNVIKDNMITVRKSLSSYEYYSISLLGFAFIMLVMSLAAGIFQERENGMFNRIISTSISKPQYFNYSLMSSFIVSVLINVIYVFTYRIMGLSFGGSLALLLAIVLVQSILGIAATAVIVAFFNKKTSMIFMNILMLVQVILGGMFLPLEKLGDGGILKTLSAYSPDILLSKAYKGYILYNSFEAISFYLLAMLGVSALLYTVSLIKVSIKWGE